MKQRIGSKPGKEYDKAVYCYPAYLNMRCHGCSVVLSSPTLCNPMDCSMQGVPIPNYPQSLPKFMSIASVMPSSRLILWCPLLHLLSIISSIRTFPMSYSSHQVTKILELQLQHQYFQWVFRGWFLLRLTGLISLLSKGFSGVFSSTTFKGINSLALCLLYGTALTIVHDHLENHSLDHMTFCQQSDVSAFQHTVWICHYF